MPNAITRAGYGPLKGAANHRVIWSPTAPVSPRFKDVWINENTFEQFYYNGSGWISIGLGRGSIGSLITDDVQVINFKSGNPLTTKMSIGLVKDKTNTFYEPGLSMGAGDGAGGNRGYITKDTNSLNLYYIGQLSNNEVAGLAIYKDKIESTVPITINKGLASEFIVDATNWNAKLTEASAKQIVENPAKLWQIPKQNIKNADVSVWDNAASTASTLNTLLNITRLNSTYIQDAALDASKFNTKQIILANETWTDNSPSSGYIAWNAHQLYFGGVKYNISASNTNLKYVYWIYGSSTYSKSATLPTLGDKDFIIAVNNSGVHDVAWYSRLARQFIGAAYIADAVITDAHIANATITSAKIASIDAAKINVGTLTGFTIQTGVANTNRFVMSGTGLIGYNTSNQQNGVAIQSTNMGQVQMWYNDTNQGYFGYAGGNMQMIGWGNALQLETTNGSINIRPGSGNGTSGNTNFYGGFDVSNCTTMIGTKKIYCQETSTGIPTDGSAIWIKL